MTMPTLLALLKANDPHPMPTAQPDKHPVSGEPWIPFHIVLADYHDPRHLVPVGRVCVNILAEMVAYNAHVAAVTPPSQDVEELTTSAKPGPDPRNGLTDKDDRQGAPVFDFYPVRGPRTDDVDLGAVKCVAFAENVVAGGKERMSGVIDKLTTFMRKRGSIEPKIYPREDVYGVYADPRSQLFTPASAEPATESGLDADLAKTKSTTTTSMRMMAWGNEAFTMIRMVTPHFGTLWLGAHVIVYEGEGKNMKVWMQRRGASVDLCGMLDTTAGGAIESGESPLEGAIKEAGEEAKLSEEIVRRYVRCTGVQSLFMYAKRDPRPLINHLYEMKRPDPNHPDYAATQPRMNDEECDEFELLTVPELLRALLTGLVQPHAVPNIVYFLIRHALVPEEERADLEELKERCHRPHDVGVPYNLRAFCDEQRVVV